MIYHNEQIDTVLGELATDPDSGLSHSDIVFRIAEYGENKLAEKKKKTNFQRFKEQFKDVMILILIAAREDTQEKMMIRCPIGGSFMISRI